eukprot:gene868-biopygen9337
MVLRLLLSAFEFVSLSCVADSGCVTDSGVHALVGLVGNACLHRTCFSEYSHLQARTSDPEV